MNYKSKFLEAYETYTISNEAPHNYHAWSALSALGALLGRKCFLPQGLYTLYPNLYVVLVGTAGMRKSTAMNVAKDLLRVVETVPLAAESTTREALIDSLSKNKVNYTIGGKALEYHQAVAFVTEMEEFLGGSHINSALISFLTTIWDEKEFKYATKGAGEVSISSPYFSLLGCTNPAWIASALKLKVISGGFTRRVIFVLENELSCRAPWPEIKPEQAEAWAVLTMEAKRIHKLAGHFELTGEAREFWTGYYNELDLLAKDRDEKVQGYFSSKHVLVLKLSICLSAAFRNDRVIDESILRLGVKIMDMTERNIDEIFSGVGRNELKPILEKIHKQVQDAPDQKLTSRKLMALNYGDVNQVELQEILTSLQVMGLLELVPSQDVRSIVYQATTKVKQSQEESLWQLIHRIGSPDAAPNSASAANSPQLPHLDQATLRRLADQEQRQRDLALGLLLRAKPADSVQKSPSPEDSQGPYMGGQIEPPL